MSDDIHCDLTLAHEIEDHYTAYRKQFYPNGFERKTIDLNPAFKKAANIVEELGANAELYVKYHFDHYGKDIRKEYLHGKNSQDIYISKISKLDGDYNRQISLQLDYLTDQIELCKRKVEYVLLDDKLSFAPWFRICASVDPIPEVIEKYRSAAKPMLNDELKNALLKNKMDWRRISII